MPRRQPKGTNRLHINLTDAQFAQLAWLTEHQDDSFSRVIGGLISAAYTEAHRTNEPAPPEPEP
jgi:predicted small integral membrane protein